MRRYAASEDSEENDDDEMDEWCLFLSDDKRSSEEFLICIGVELVDDVVSRGRKIVLASGEKV